MSSTEKMRDRALVEFACIDSGDRLSFRSRCSEQKKPNAQVEKQHSNGHKKMDGTLSLSLFPAIDVGWMPNRYKKKMEIKLLH